jgi:hypothetical protein
MMNNTCEPLNRFYTYTMHINFRKLYRSLYEFSLLEIAAAAPAATAPSPPITDETAAESHPIPPTPPETTTVHSVSSSLTAAFRRRQQSCRPACRRSGPAAAATGVKDPRTF